MHRALVKHPVLQVQVRAGSHNRDTEATLRWSRSCLAKGEAASPLARHRSSAIRIECYCFSVGPAGRAPLRFRHRAPLSGGWSEHIRLQVRSLPYDPRLAVVTDPMEHR